MMFVLMLGTLIASAVYAQEPIEGQRVEVRVLAGEPVVSIRSSGPIVCEEPGFRLELDPGLYTLEPVQPVAAQQRFHLFAKTFGPGESGPERGYMAMARDRGFSPQAVPLGKLLHTVSGRLLDSRIHWISIARETTLEDAEKRKRSLEEQDQWTWMQAETLVTGKGFLRVKGADGKIVASFSIPVTMHSGAPIEISNVDIGFWKERRERLSYSGALEFRVGPDALLEVIEELTVEEYLRGVLPAEMPANWEPEALKAQAVAARSDVIAGLGSRYSLEGFDFLGNEQSRAYLGAAGHKPETDEALRQTESQILVKGGRIVPAVYSATCGGWTEDNDTVWYGPPDDALRGVRCAEPSDATRGPNDQNARAWLASSPQAYCAHNTAHFRWRKVYLEDEIRAIINERHPVGRIRDIELGLRGVSGRLKWVRVIGSDEVVTIQKELPIRLAFGGLPSAMFVLDVHTGANSRKVYTFSGGGRGHGVGMCQNGAQGMALTGRLHTDILKHYYSGAEVERYR